MLRTFAYVSVFIALNTYHMHGNDDIMLTLKKAISSLEEHNLLQHQNALSTLSAEQKKELLSFANTISEQYTKHATHQRMQWYTCLGAFSISLAFHLSSASSIIYAISCRLHNEENCYGNTSIGNLFLAENVFANLGLYGWTLYINKKMSDKLEIMKQEKQAASIQTHLNKMLYPQITA